VSASSKASYKRVRNWIALALAVIWAGGWYVHLDAQRTRATEHMNACASTSAPKPADCGWFGSWGSDETNGFVLTMGMIVVVLSSVVMFLPARYLARRYMAIAEARENRQEEAEQMRLQQQQERESVARSVRNEAEANAALRQISRGEIIHKLGAINDLTDLLPVETDEERLMNIRHGVAQALRELAAKYTSAELAALIKSDDMVEHTARAVVARLDASPLRTVVEIQALRVVVQ
jgi:hypothetical protein